MAEPEPKTLVCPQCGNTNPYTADECLKCGLSLGPIREALVKVSAPAAEAEPTPSAPTKPKEPVPEMPKLPPTPTTQDIGTYVDGERILVRGMADKVQDVAAFFFKQLSERGIEKVSLSSGSLIIDKESRGYYFAERDLGREAASTMAVRIAPVGKDLFVEWRHYTTPPLGAFHFGIFLGISAVAVAISLALSYATGETVGYASGQREAAELSTCVLTLILGMVIAAAVAAGKARKMSLNGFQSQDSTAFQMAVRASIEEAIDLAGISKELIQEVPKEQRRVI